MYIDPTVNKEVFGWHSPALDLDMPIVRYGHYGHALLLFPTAQSDLYDAERFYLIKAIEHHLLYGRVNVFAINTINDLSWMNRNIGPKEKARRQALYARIPSARVCLPGRPACHIRHRWKRVGRGAKRTPKSPVGIITPLFFALDGRPLLPQAVACSL